MIIKPLDKTTILGIGFIAGMACGIIAQVLTHDMDLALGLGTLAFGAVHIFLPENKNAPEPVQALVMDVVKAVVTKSVVASLPKIFADFAAVEQALQPVAPPATTVTTVTTTTPAPVSLIPVATVAQVTPEQTVV